MTGAQLHAAADANHDGKLSYLEYAASIFRSEKHGPDHFVLADSNHDGTLSVAELTAMLPSVDWWKFSRKSPADWIKAADKDGNGKINVTEFEALTSSKNHVEAFFARADKDKSGALDASEVAAYLKGVIERLEDEE
jgi:Ca2+-binding EF-hand superfamily protein